MKTLFSIFILIFTLAGCIGTDYVDDPTVPARLIISPRIDSLQVGETVQLSSTYFNELGVQAQISVNWKSSAPAVVTIDQTGKAIGLAAGPAKIIATAGNAADTLVLNTTGVTNSTTLRLGTFQNAGSHYQASGNASLEQLPNGNLKLSFENNFTVSAGPSLYILLANHTDGSYTVMPGNNAVNGNSAQITSTKLTTFSGAMSFDVPAGVKIMDYKYVVLYCTLGPVFGFADLK